MTDFLKSVSVLLDEEGGYVNDPKDPGGETNFGISKRSYPKLKIRSLTKDQAIEIYKRDYWDKVRGDDLPSGLSLLTFDCAVNQGTDAAIRMLQEACGAVVDGLMGPNTILRAGIDPEATLAKFSALRSTRYAKNVNFNLYGRGWMNRLCRMIVRSSLMLK